MSKTQLACFGVLGIFIGCNGPLAPGDIIGIGNATGGQPTYPGSGGSHAAGATGSGGHTSTTTTTGCGNMPNTASGGSMDSCSASTDLIAKASGPEGNWIGGDPALTIDNPCGVQGAIYAYSDLGLDNVAGTPDDSLQSPAVVTEPAASNNRQSPCANGKCCISGKTSLWPIDSTGAFDYTANVWGAGIGISLNSDGLTDYTKSAYNGPARGFVIHTSGTLNGQVIRIVYTQSSDDELAPFVETTRVGAHAVLFTDVACPVWGLDCVAPTAHPYDLQLQVVGGDVTGDFAICVDSITPIL